MAKKQNKPIKTCAEYITKDQVIEWFRPYGHTGEDIPFYVLDDDIFEMKAADVAPVVRCRDCKHYEIHKPKVLENCERNGYIIPMKPDDFCSYGERKDGDGNG